MHIYYATRGLRGRPYHSDIINTDLFAFFQGKRMRTIPSAETLRAVNAFPKCDIDMGEDTDSEYVCEKGTFYIPKSICMGEVVNAGWAVDYYFVVLCGDAVELRYVRWDCPWYETVGRDTEVTDPAVIAKMERTLAMLLDANKPRIPAPVPISRPALLTFLTLLGVADAEALAGKIHAAATTPEQCAALCGRSLHRLACYVDAIGPAGPETPGLGRLEGSAGRSFRLPVLPLAAGGKGTPAPLR